KAKKRVGRTSPVPRHTTSSNHIRAMLDMPAARDSVAYRAGPAVRPTGPCYARDSNWPTTFGEVGVISEQRRGGSVVSVESAQLGEPGKDRSVSNDCTQRFEIAAVDDGSQCSHDVSAAHMVQRVAERHGK